MILQKCGKMDNIDYYGLGLSGGEFPPPHSFDSEESYNMAWEQFSEGMQKRYSQPEKHGIRVVREEGYKKSKGDSNMYESKLKRRIRRIVEKNCGRGRVREMDDAIPGMGEPDEDVRELAKYHALNGDKDHMLYRDNPDYKDAYDEMTMRESINPKTDYQYWYAVGQSGGEYPREEEFSSEQEYIIASEAYEEGQDDAYEGPMMEITKRQLKRIIANNVILEDMGQSGRRSQHKEALKTLNQEEYQSSAYDPIRKYVDGTIDASTLSRDVEKYIKSAQDVKNKEGGYLPRKKRAEVEGLMSLLTKLSDAGGDDSDAISGLRDRMKKGGILETFHRGKIRISKRQLKQIIKEEYSRIRR